MNQYPNDIAPRYKSNTNLSSRVGHLNPRWNEKVTDHEIDVSLNCFRVVLRTLIEPRLIGKV
jgi:hypothetical protein